MIGQIIGNYKILEQIGEGGMGTVYKGMDILLERQVAIKLLRPELAHDQGLIKRFRAEAVALARLNHPNIVMLYSFIPHNDQFFMVLEFVQGETLDKIIKRCGAIPWQQAILLTCQALDGLEHAHSFKVIHRDIKPANMALTPAGTLKLMDFGIARILQTARLTRTGHLFGTLEYMSPEQIQGKETDSRTDIYSLGIVLYEMLTGHIPFIANSDFELLKAQIEKLPQPPRSLTPQLPAELDNVVLRALAKAPEKRFQEATEFRTALEKLMTTALTGGQQTSPPYDIRFGNTLPRSRNSLPASGGFPNPIAAPQHGNFLDYIKRYPVIVASVLMIAGVATFIGVAHRPGTQVPLSGSNPPTSIPAKPEAANPIVPSASGQRTNTEKPINPAKSDSATTQQETIATEKPTSTPTQDQALIAQPRAQPTLTQPQDSPSAPPKTVVTETQPAPVKAETTPPASPVVSDSKIPASKKSTPEKSKKTVQPKQSVQSKSPPPPPKKQNVAAPNKSRPKTRSSTGHRGSGGWELIY